ncbi:MAG: hypothetical protein RR620_08775 [Clostridium sp.]
MQNILNRIKSKDGGAELVIILIAIIIFGAVTVATLSPIGKEINSGADTAVSVIDNMLK